MSKFQAHKDAPDEVWLQIGYGDEGEHTWAAHQVAEDDIEQAGPYVRADRLSGRVTVSVKPLEWEETQIARGDGMHEHDGGYEAVTPIGIYGIEMYFGSDSHVWEVSLPAVGKVADCDDPDTAKAAAQADFESRILAAINTAPAPSPDQIRREALTLIERLYYIEGKDAEWRAARMNSVAREAQSPEPNLSRFHRIFPRSVFTGGDDDHSNP